MRALLKTATEDNAIIYNEEIVTVKLDTKHRSDFVRHFIGESCLLEFVPLNAERTLFMGLDENGLAKGLPFNFFIQLNNPFFKEDGPSPSRVDVIAGNVVFVRVKDCNSCEMENITDEDYKEIMQLLHPLNQKRLCDTYNAILNMYC